MTQSYSWPPPLVAQRRPQPLKVTRRRPQPLYNVERSRPSSFMPTMCQLYVPTMCRCNRALWGAADFMGPQLIIFAIAFSWPWTFTSGRKCWVLPRPCNHLLGLFLVTAHKYPSAQGYVQLIAIIMHYHAAHYGALWCCPSTYIECLVTFPARYI